MSGLARYEPYALAALRIMSGLIYMQHGLEKMFHFPDVGHHPGPYELFSLVGVAGVLELFGGAAIALGLLTRPIAFLLCGEMAVAYFTIHLPAGLNMPRGFFPVVNGGDLAILFCFVFLAFFITGPGAWSIDGLLSRARAPDGAS